MTPGGFGLRNPLAYPAGRAAGFDPTHPAAPGCVASVVASQGNVINLLTGAKATLVGTPTAANLGGLGPCTGYIAAGSESTVSVPSVSPSTLTQAAIFQVPAIGIAQGYQFIIAAQGNSGMFYVSAGTGTPTMGWFLGGNAGSGLTVPINTPVFIAASYNRVTLFFVLVNLLTGAMQTSSVAIATAPGANGGIVAFGNDPASSSASMLQGYLARGMYSLGYVPPRALIAWAYDPWLFWHPLNVMERQPLVGVFVPPPPSIFFVTRPMGFI
jgi:hypothetical protein